MEEVSGTFAIKLECSKCGSRFIYTTKDEIVCRRCGYREKREEVNKDGGHSWN